MRFVFTGRIVYPAKGEIGEKIGYNVNMTKFFTLLTGFALAGLLGATAARAQEMHPVLKKFQDEKHAKIEFLGRDHGLDGWLITGKNDAGADIVQYAYSTPEGGIVLGVMFGPTGEVVTIKQLEDYRARMKAGGSGAASLETLAKGMEPPKSIEGPADAAPDLKSDAVPKAEKFYALTEAASWVQVGKKDAPYMYVFFNVTCDHCVNYWKMLKKYVDDGTLALRMVPFGTSPRNKTLGAALLAAGDPDEAWRNFAGGNASALDEKAADRASLKKIESNTALFGEFGLKSGPPFSIYRAPADGKIKVVVGKPDNIMVLIADFVN